MIKRNLPLMITLGVFVLGYLYCLTQFPLLLPPGSFAIS